MELFNLPKSTEFGRVIPKNAFDEYTNTKQKKEISDSILRITWTHKLSSQTTNLESKDVTEIQIFLIELKLKTDLKRILAVIDKSIPYHIVFILKYDNEILVSTSAKHDHISKANEAVIDCTFRTTWTEEKDISLNLRLLESLDQTYIRFCSQVTDRSNNLHNYSAFIAKEIEIKTVELKIINLENQIRREKQYNKKVNLNMVLAGLKKELDLITT